MPSGVKRSLQSLTDSFKNEAEDELERRQEKLKKFVKLLHERQEVEKELQSEETKIKRLLQRAVKKFKEPQKEYIMDEDTEKYSSTDCTRLQICVVKKSQGRQRVASVKKGPDNSLFVGNFVEKGVPQNST